MVARPTEIALCELLFQRHLAVCVLSKRSVSYSLFLLVLERIAAAVRWPTGADVCGARRELLKWLAKGGIGGRVGRMFALG